MVNQGNQIKRVLNLSSSYYQHLLKDENLPHEP